MAIGTKQRQFSRTRDLKTTGQAILRAAPGTALAFLPAFFAAGAVLTGDVCPFGAALAAGESDKQLLPACIGAAVGAVVFCAPGTAVKNVGAVFLLFILRLALRRLSPEKRRPVYEPMLTFLAVFSASLSAAFVSDVTPTRVFLCLGEGLLTAVLSLCTRRAYTVISGGPKPIFASLTDSVCVLISLSLVLASMTRFSVFGVRIGLLLAWLSVPALCRLSSPFPGLGWGVCAGAVLGLTASDPFPALCLPAAALLTSALLPYGRLPAFSAFGLVCGAGLFLDKNNAASPASLIFLLL